MRSLHRPLYSAFPSQLLSPVPLLVTPRRCGHWLAEGLAPCQFLVPGFPDIFTARANFILQILALIVVADQTYASMLTDGHCLDLGVYVPSFCSGG